MHVPKYSLNPFSLIGEIAGKQIDVRLQVFLGDLEIVSGEDNAIEVWMGEKLDVGDLRKTGDEIVYSVAFAHGCGVQRDIELEASRPFEAGRISARTVVLLHHQRLESLSGKCSGTTEPAKTGANDYRIELIPRSICGSSSWE